VTTSSLKTRSIMIVEKLYIIVTTLKSATGKLQHRLDKYINSYLCFCSTVLIPGVALLPRGLLAVFYALALVYLFLGIGIVSDVFMA
jgi:hypothetical protein